MYVTEDDLIKHAHAYQSILQDIARQHFEANEITRYFVQLRSANLICYVSTKFGVAFEYQFGEEMVISSRRGSARIEDLLIDAPKKIKNIGPIMNIGGSNIELFDAELDGAFPFRLTQTHAHLRLRHVTFSDSRGWSRFIEYADVFGDRSKSCWTTDAAQHRAHEEVLRAMLWRKHNLAVNPSEDISGRVRQWQEKNVLVLGSYSNTNLPRLEEICEILRKSGYTPLMLKDVQDFPHFDLSQKVSVLGSLSRFIVVEDSCRWTSYGAFNL